MAVIFEISGTQTARGFRQFIQGCRISGARPSFSVRHDDRRLEVLGAHYRAKSGGPGGVFSRENGGETDQVFARRSDCQDFGPLAVLLLKSVLSFNRGLAPEGGPIPELDLSVRQDQDRGLLGTPSQRQ